MSRAPHELGYASVAEGLPRRDRMVVRLTVVGLSIFAVGPCASAVIDLIPAITSRSTIELWYLVEIAIGVACVPLAIVGLRSMTPASARLWSWLVAAVAIATIPTVLYVTVESWHQIAMLRGWTLPHQTSWILDRVSRLAVCVFALLPALLLRARSPASWRRRALVVAAVCSIIAGLDGPAQLIWDGLSVQQHVGGSLVQGIQAALQRPRPFIGLWPIAGLVTGGMLLASLSKPRVVTVRMAVALGFTFIIFSDVRREAMKLGAPVRSIADVWLTVLPMLPPLCDLVPLAVLGWATWADREHLFDETDETWPVEVEAV